MPVFRRGRQDIGKQRASRNRIPGQPSPAQLGTHRLPPRYRALRLDLTQPGYPFGKSQ
ncbi:hypothetical protein ACFFX0_13220 [Citricoccus parietis]|uniref:Uncharacterized protein n=1 Tax=Citricoccus parietis TaxID=592307 RepID=A0ABV5FZJ0_9MICC